MNKPRTIVGMSIVTSNDAAQNQNTIGKLWEAFLQSSIKEQLKNISSPSIFAVYSDYENGYMGKYKITIGYAVDDLSAIPKELSVVVIPSGNYKVYHSKSQDVQDIINTWQTIWQLDPKLFLRSFVADFEEYTSDGKMTINIAYAQAI